jgi:hypothetical protein
MQRKPEFRRSERFPHEYIIQLGEDLTLSPYYAVSRNLSETGMYFKSLFELYSGAQNRIVINDYMSSQNHVSDRVVWCKKLEGTATFRYGVGVEFLDAQINSGSTASLPTTPRMKSPGTQGGGTVIQMSERSLEQ